MSNQGCYEDPIDLTASEVDDEKPLITHSGISVAVLGQVFDKLKDSSYNSCRHHYEDHRIHRYKP